MKYLNQTDRELLLSVLACISCLEISSREKMFSGHGAELLEISERVKSICDEVADGYEQDSMRAAYNLAENVTIRLMPKSSPKAREDYTVVKKDVISRITANTLFECGMCDKTGKDVKRCATRRDLIECGVDMTNGVCEYRREDL